MTSARTAAARLVEAAPIFAALGDPTRLRIVARLGRDGPQAIVRLAEDSAVTRQAISKHLRALEDAGLVRSQRRGRERIWEIQTRRLAEAQRHLGLISAQWDAAIGRLRAFVDG